MSGYDVTAACSTCGQVLVLPAYDLRAAFACPRCGNTYAAASLVQPSTPLTAIPVTAPEAAIAVEPLRPIRAWGAAPVGQPLPAMNVSKAGRRAWSFATWLAVGLGDAAWWLDRVTYGKRLLLLSALAGAVLLAQHL